MIRVRHRTDGRAHTLVMVGHAEYDEHGKDIVCAGASAIVYALVGFLDNHTDDVDKINLSMNSGDVTLFCEGNERVAAAFDMAVIGLAQIARKYKDHVTVEDIPL